MSESQDLIFGIIATPGSRSTSRFQSPLTIPSLNGLNIHPEQMSHRMTRQWAFNVLMIHLCVEEDNLGYNSVLTTPGGDSGLKACLNARPAAFKT
jgi:hypothetical protein